jgi:hypothetical protein
MVTNQQSHDSPHSMHHNHVGTMANDGSTWPSTCGRWHGAQFCTWFLHTWPSRPSNNKTPKDKPFLHIKWHDQLQTLAYWINFPWPTMAITCPNHLYALFLTHIFINLFSPYGHSLNQAINFKMITNSSPMVDQSLLTQFLKLSSRFHALIHEHFCWGTKST